jgi:hypothetical protein
MNMLNPVLARPEVDRRLRAVRPESTGAGR